MARVLVVDDENLMRTMVEVACRRLGHEALCAATLAEGRRLAAAGVDVILLDMLLPDGKFRFISEPFMYISDFPAIPSKQRSICFPRQSDKSRNSFRYHAYPRRKKPCAAVSGIFS